MKPITVTWRELYDLVAARDCLLATDSEYGYMELEVPEEYRTDNPELWRNCNDGMEEREDLLCLHLHAPGPYADEYEDYYIELPPDFMIAVESTGKVVVPYSFDMCGEPLDYHNLIIMDTAHLYPVRREDGVDLVREDRENTQRTQP